MEDLYSRKTFFCMLFNWTNKKHIAMLIFDFIQYPCSTAVDSVFLSNQTLREKESIVVMQKLSWFEWNKYKHLCNWVKQKKNRIRIIQHIIIYSNRNIYFSILTKIIHFVMSFPFEELSVLSRVGKLRRSNSLAIADLEVPRFPRK